MQITDDRDGVDFGCVVFISPPLPSTESYGIENRRWSSSRRKTTLVDMIVSSEKAPVKASVVRVDNPKVQFAFDGANGETGGFSLSAETEVRTAYS